MTYVSSTPTTPGVSWPNTSNGAGASNSSQFTYTPDVSGNTQKYQSQQDTDLENYVWACVASGLSDAVITGLLSQVIVQCSQNRDQSRQLSLDEAYNALQLAENSAQEQKTAAQEAFNGAIAGASLSMAAGAIELGSNLKGMAEERLNTAKVQADADELFPKKYKTTTSAQEEESNTATRTGTSNAGQSSGSGSGSGTDTAGTNNKSAQSRTRTATRDHDNATNSDDAQNNVNEPPPDYAQFDKDTQRAIQNSLEEFPDVNTPPDAPSNPAPVPGTGASASGTASSPAVAGFDQGAGDAAINPQEDRTSMGIPAHMDARVNANVDPAVDPADPAVDPAANPATNPATTRQHIVPTEFEEEKVDLSNPDPKNNLNKGPDLNAKARNQYIANQSRNFAAKLDNRMRLVQGITTILSALGQIVNANGQLQSSNDNAQAAIQKALSDFLNARSQASNEYGADTTAIISAAIDAINAINGDRHKAIESLWA